MRPLARLGALAAGAAALGTVGCAQLAWLRAPRLAECPGPIVDAAAIPGGDFLLRERMRVRGGDVDASFEIAAERRGARLVLVGFDPLGVRVFSVEQLGSRITSESRIGRALALPPENALRDLHAARFSGADPGLPIEVTRPGCGYTASFVRIERRELH